MRWTPFKAACESVSLPFRYRSSGNPLKKADEILRDLSVSKLNSLVSTKSPLDLLNRPIAGSFVEYTESGLETAARSRYGIVLESLPQYLTGRPFRVVTPDGRVDEISANQITFHIREFARTTGDPAALAYVLNVFSGLSFKMSNELVRRDLPQRAFIQLAQTQKQGSVAVDEMAALFLNDRSFSHVVSASNALAYPALMHSAHQIMLNDPLHYRFVRPDYNPRAFLHPLQVQSRTHFVNSASLADALAYVFYTDSSILLNKYASALSTSERYRSFVLLSEDQGFRNLVTFIKYAIQYPHIKLSSKLDSLFLPLENGPSPKSLFDFLVSLGIYKQDTNPILSSEIHGQIRQSRAAGMVCDSLGDLHPYTKVVALTKHDRREHSQEIPVKPHGNSASLIYRISKDIAFSTQKLSLTRHQFNFFLVVPTRRIESWMISSPVNYSPVIGWDQLPPNPGIYGTMSKPRTCFRISFTVDYMRKESLTEPEVEITLDKFRHTQLLGGSTTESTNGIKKLDVAGKLRNLLETKKHARVQNGVLLLETEQESLAESAARMLDEFLSLYCEKKGVSVIRRSLQEDATESADSRKSTRFKIFKWYANSYETFRQSGRMDVTNFISCLKYLKSPTVGSGAYKPLGLASFASFTDSNFFESFINKTQLLNHLTGNPSLDLESLTPKVLSNSEAFLQLKSQLKRYEVLKRLESDSGPKMLRCIIVDPAVSTSIDGNDERLNARAYCPELDIMVEVQLAQDMMVGDRIICSEIMELDPVGSKIIVR